MVRNLPKYLIALSFLAGCQQDDETTENLGSSTFIISDSQAEGYSNRATIFGNPADNPIQSVALVIDSMSPLGTDDDGAILSDTDEISCEVTLASTNYAGQVVTYLEFLNANSPMPIKVLINDLSIQAGLLSPYLPALVKCRSEWHPINGPKSSNAIYSNGLNLGLQEDRPENLPSSPGDGGVQ